MSVTKNSDVLLWKQQFFVLLCLNSIILFCVSVLFLCVLVEWPLNEKRFLLSFFFFFLSLSEHCQSNTVSLWRWNKGSNNSTQLNSTNFLIFFSGKEKSCLRANVKLYLKTKVLIIWNALQSDYLRLSFLRFVCFYFN